jgi:hypothetical protein
MICVEEEKYNPFRSLGDRFYRSAFSASSVTGKYGRKHDFVFSRLTGWSSHPPIHTPAGTALRKHAVVADLLKRLQYSFISIAPFPRNKAVASRGAYGQNPRSRRYEYILSRIALSGAKSRAHGMKWKQSSTMPTVSRFTPSDIVSLPKRNDRSVGIPYEIEAGA